MVMRRHSVHVTVGCISLRDTRNKQPVTPKGFMLTSYTTKQLHPEDFFCAIADRSVFLYAGHVFFLLDEIYAEIPICTSAPYLCCVRWSYIDLPMALDQFESFSSVQLNNSKWIATLESTGGVLQQ